METGGPKRRSSHLVDALHTVHAGDFADIGEDGLELAAIGDFQAGVDARIRTVGPAFQAVDVGAGAADYGCNFSQEAGAVACADHQLHLERGRSCAAPLDSDAPFGLVQQILDVRARPGVNGDAAPPRDVADDVVAGNGIAALRAIHQEIVIAFDDEGSLAKTQHALYGLDQRRLCIFRGRLVGLRSIAENAGENVARGVFSEAYRSIEVLNFRQAGIGGEPEPILFW